MRFSRSDAAVTAAVVILSSFLFFLFWKDLNSIAVRNNETALGDIVFRKGSATRRSLSGMNWERLRSQSPVYGGDTIRTADFSEAAVFFEDGANLDLFENSMIKLSFIGEEKAMEFLDGQVSLSGGEGRTITVGSKTVSFSDDSKVSFARTGNDISIGVSGGTATVTGEDGRRETLGSSQELLLNAVSGDYRVIDRSAVLLRPSPNARLLNLGEKASRIPFSWEITSPESLAGSLELELSAAFDFESSESLTVTADAAEIKAPLQPGTWYWRLRDGNGVISAVSRFSLTEAAPPEPILPTDGTGYSYRKIPPNIAFSWTDMAEASAYLFEVAADPDFHKPIIRSRTILNSLTVNALDEGIWYWRVIPVPAGEVLGGEMEPEVRRIEISKKNAMNPPVPYYALDGALYQLQVMENRGIPFSWKPESEAAEYELAVADNPEMNAPRVIFRTEAPYAFLVRKDAEALYREGIYYWAVRWRDFEGGLSPWSPSRRIQGIDGTVAVRLSYPPDGYTIADSLMTNTRFAWKSNVPGRTLFQVASDEGFSDLLYEEEVQAETLLGKNWTEGEWFWRIRTFNVDGTVFLETPARRFSVVEPFAGPKMLHPARSRLFTFRDGDMQNIEWEDIPEADHYTMRIYAAGGGEAVYEKSLIPDERIDLSFDDFPDGEYRALIQGFTLENPLSTRQIGLIEENPFTLRKLTPIELVAPTDGETFEGLYALRNGIPLVWDSKVIPETTRLGIYSDPGMSRSVYESKNGSRTEVVRRLSEGKYYWTVSGTFGDFDISSRSVGRFTVNPVPPLPPPVLTDPPEDAVYGPEQLRASRQILFSWEEIAGATDYYLAIYPDENWEKPVLTIGPLKETSYLLEDLSILDKGNFAWIVFGESRDQEGYVEQPGEEAQRLFSINLPSLGTPSIDSGEKFYGR